MMHEAQVTVGCSISSNTFIQTLLVAQRVPPYPMSVYFGDWCLQLASPDSDALRYKVSLVFYPSLSRIVHLLSFSLKHHPLAEDSCSYGRRYRMRLHGVGWAVPAQARQRALPQGWQC
jgi:hypothetical protein